MSVFLCFPFFEWKGLSRSEYSYFQAHSRYVYLIYLKAAMESD